MYKHLCRDKRHSLFNNTIDGGMNKSYYNMDSIGDLSDEASHRVKHIESNLSKQRHGQASNLYNTMEPNESRKLPVQLYPQDSRYG